MAPSFPTLIRLLLLLAAPVSLASAREPVLGGACSSCSLVFTGLPASLTTDTRIAPESEPGSPMIIEGKVTSLDGRAVSGIIIYAYHTDRSGVYPSSDDVPREARRHGRLRAWVITDANGRYRFRTIRPGSYPSQNNPAHVHLHVIEPGKGIYHVDDLHFDDDPLLTPGIRRHLSDRGGPGIAQPTQDEHGVWQARRDIVLGKNIPDYPH